METALLYFLYYILAMNVIAFVMMGADKRKAALQKSRISERVLFITALLGGSAGIFGGMYIFRHKTKHNSFKYGIPAILTVQITAAYILFYRVLNV